MGKSEGNFLTLQTLVDAGHAPMAYRYLTYTAHYRSHLTYSEEAMDAASSALRNIHKQFAALPADPGAAPNDRLMARFRDTLRDDLNAPQALAVMWETLRDATVPTPVRRATLLAMDEVLPLGLSHVEASVESSGPPPEVEALLHRRLEARASKDWKASDAIRGEIAALGWEVRDTPQGQVATPAGQ
jgi:cysteinyl-tRNA synthetase